MDLVGQPARPDQHRDGVSFAESLGGRPHDRETSYWHYPHYSNQGGRPGTAIREGDWKLIESFEDHSVQLFNLRQDRGELNDQSETEPAMRNALQNKLHDWLTEVDAVLPAVNEVKAPVGIKNSGK